MEWLSVGRWRVARSVGAWAECQSAGVGRRGGVRVRVWVGGVEWESMELDMFGFFNFILRLIRGDIAREQLLSY